MIPELRIYKSNLHGLPIEHKQYILNNLSFVNGGFQQLYQTRRIVYIVYAAIGDQIIGWAAMDLSLLNIMSFVDFEFQNKGLATILIKECLKDKQPLSVYVYSKTMSKILTKLGQKHEYIDLFAD